jgi:hypothetical protein
MQDNDNKPRREKTKYNPDEKKQNIKNKIIFMSHSLFYFLMQ